MPFVGFLELGLDKLKRGAGHDFLLKAVGHIRYQASFATDETGFQHRGSDRHVGLGLAHALVDRAGGVTDLQA